MNKRRIDVEWVEIVGHTIVFCSAMFLVSFSLALGIMLAVKLLGGGC